MCLWVCFNSIIRKKYGETLGDRTLINKAKEDRHWKSIFKKVWKNPGFKQLFLELATYSIENMKDQHPRRIKEIDNYSFEDLIEVVYQIRCNLFHGRKKPRAVGGCRLRIDSISLPITFSNNY